MELEVLPKTHKLKKGDFFLVVEETGGNIVSFSYLYKSNHIFFPRMGRNDGKMRGGSHICFPHFGSKDGEVGNHGFGRSSFPTLVENGSLDHMHLTFDDFEISYEMTEHGFKQRLECANPEKFDLFNPGFHPYFFVPTSVVGGAREGKVTFLSSGGLGRHFIDFRNISKKSQTYNVAMHSEICIVVDHGEFNLRFETSEPITDKSNFALCLWREEDSWVCVEPIFSKHSNPKQVSTKPFWMEMTVEFYPNKNIPA